MKITPSIFKKTEIFKGENVYVCFNSMSPFVSVCCHYKETNSSSIEQTRQHASSAKLVWQVVGFQQEVQS